MKATAALLAQPRYAAAAMALSVALVVPAVAGADPGQSPARDESAQVIADKAKAQSSGLGMTDATAELTLKITTKSKELRVRQLSVKSKREGGLNKSLVRFTSPPDVAGTAFLALENQGRDNDQYLYLPALGKTKRIASSQRNQSFMGTDFTYADLDSKYLAASDLRRLGDDSAEGVACFVLESGAIDGSTYARAKIWIDKQTYLARRVEFFDKDGQLWKVLRTLKVKTTDGRNVITESVMEDVKKGSKTEVSIDKIDFKARLDDHEFTEKNLSRG